MNENAQTLPHDIDAEENLLSSCLLDGDAIIDRCHEAQIFPGSFYVGAHGVIFGILTDLRRRQAPVSTDILAVELKSRGQLEAVGGYPFLTQVTSRIPTTAQANYFIETVRQLEIRREIIRRGNAVAEAARVFTGATDDLIAEARSAFEIVGRAPIAAHEMDLDALLGFDVSVDTDCLMGRRFIGRTGSCVVVAPAGVGKSVLSMQFGCCATLGRPFFGLKMAAPMRVLYVQAEDDMGDVAEALQGFARTYKLTADDIAELRARFRIVRWNDAAGDKFLSRLRSEHARHPFDLVIINPLFSFCGCSVSEQREMSAFLRNGLNPILNEARAAAIIVHHTNKPPSDKQGAQPDGNAELRYVGSGSAELTNWARAYITLQSVKAAGDGVFKMSFAKRGTRAGIVDADGKPTTSILIQHSPHGLCWVPSDYSQAKGEGGKFAPRFDVARAAEVYEPTATWTDNEQAIALDQDIDRRTVRRYRQNILDTAA